MKMEQTIKFEGITQNPNARKSYEQFFLTKGQLAQSLMNCSTIIRQRVGVFESRVMSGHNYWFDPDKTLQRMDELEKVNKAIEFMARLEKARRHKAWEARQGLNISNNDWLAGRLGK